MPFQPITRASLIIELLATLVLAGSALAQGQQAVLPSLETTPRSLEDLNLRPKLPQGDSCRMYTPRGTPSSRDITAAAARCDVIVLPFVDSPNRGALLAQPPKGWAFEQLGSRDNPGVFGYDTNTFQRLPPPNDILSAASKFFARDSFAAVQVAPNAPASRPYTYVSLLLDPDQAKQTPQLDFLRSLRASLPGPLVVSFRDRSSAPDPEAMPGFRLLPTDTPNAHIFVATAPGVFIPDGPLEAGIEVRFDKIVIPQLQHRACILDAVKHAPVTSETLAKALTAAGFVSSTEGASTQWKRPKPLVWEAKNPDGSPQRVWHHVHLVVTIVAGSGVTVVTITGFHYTTHNSDIISAEAGDLSAIDTGECKDCAPLVSELTRLLGKS